MSWNEIAATAEHQTKLATEFPHFAEHKLTLRAKDGQLKPFKLHGLQMSLWAKMQDQMQRKGRVRLAVVKPRQSGLSTMCAGLTAWLMTTQPGMQALVMGHRDDSASHVRSMIQLFLSNMPDAPAIDISNASEMRLKSGSGFAVRVASEDSGSARGLTARMVHLTEGACKFDDNMDALSAILPDLPGTFGLIETTADFQGSPYHRFYNRCAAGEAGDWEAWFAPWFAMEEYATEPPAGFELRDDEREIQKLYGLSLAQMAWRRKTLGNYSDPKRFAREMPDTVVSAFESAEIEEGFIPSDLIIAARKTDPKPLMYGDLVVSCDPAHKGLDRTVFSYRQGRAVYKIEEHRGLDGMQIAGKIARICDDLSPKAFYLDSTGIGAIILDAVRE